MLKRDFEATQLQTASSEHNATRSPLLLLPREIRDCVVLEVLGSRIIHIDVAPYPVGSHDPHQEHCSGFVCQSSRTMQEEYAAFLDTEYNLIAWSFRDQDPLRNNKNDHHYDCTQNQTAQRVRLDLLKTCRRVYNEATPILWYNSIFSFESAYTARKFMQERTAAQKGLVKQLRFNMHVPNDFGPYGWSTLLDSTFVTTLPALRTLHLVIDVCWGESYDDLTCEYMQQEMRSRCQELKRTLRPLQEAPLKEVTARISHSRQRHADDKDYLRGMGYHWPLQDCVSYAEDLAEYLKAPRPSKAPGHALVQS